MMLVMSKLFFQKKNNDNSRGMYICLPQFISSGISAWWPKLERYCTFLRFHDPFGSFLNLLEVGMI